MGQKRLWMETAMSPSGAGGPQRILVIKLRDLGGVLMSAPVVGLFGPSDPRVCGPAGERHAVVYKGVDCQLCYSGWCRRGKESSMWQIELDEVITLVEERLVQAPMRAGKS